MLEESFIFYRTDRYDVKGKRLLKTLGKYYCADVGIRNAVLGSSASDLGHMLENIVYLELKRRGYEVYIGKYDDMEIDFIAKKRNDVEYYQISLSMVDEATRERELRVLYALNDNYKKYVISLDKYTTGSFDGIQYVKIIDFLMQETE